MDNPETHAILGTHHRTKKWGIKWKIKLLTITKIKLPTIKQIKLPTIKQIKLPTIKQIKLPTIKQIKALNSLNGHSVVKSCSTRRPRSEKRESDTCLTLKKWRRVGRPKFDHIILEIKKKKQKKQIRYLRMWPILV